MSVAAQPFNDKILRRMGVPAAGSLALDGRGIAIGIADWGFDLAHPCLLSADLSRSRFHCLWDQNRSADVASGSSARLPRPDEELLEQDLAALIAASRASGSRAAIDRLLDPHANYCWRSVPDEGAHGTLMASIAAGSPHAGFRGVATAAKLLGVQLALQDHHWKEVGDDGEPAWRDWSPAQSKRWDGWRSYDEQAQILAALDYLYDRGKACGAPGLVINLSLGAAAGAHDGGSSVERRIAELVRRGSEPGGLPTVIVIAAGNSGADEGHFAGLARPHAPSTFEWRMGRNDPSPNKLEIWYRSGEPLGIELALGERAAHRGPPLATFAIPCGPTVPLTLGGRLIGVADHELRVRNGLSRARIVLHPPYFPRALPRDSHGDIVFSIELAARIDTESGAVPVQAWLERDDGVQERSSLSPCHPAGTLGSLAMAQGAIAVSGFDPREGPTAARMFALSSIGPGPWTQAGGECVPHIAAPGLGIWGAKSKTTGFSRTSGTSPAAALVSGVCALLMQDAVRRGQPIRPDEIRARLIECAQPVEDGGAAAWSPRYGWGAIHIDPLFGEAQS